MSPSWTVTLVTTALLVLGTDGFQFGSSAAAGAPVYNMVTSSYLSKCPEDSHKEEIRPPPLNSPQPHYEQLPPPPPPYRAVGPVNGVPTLKGFVVYPPADLRQVGPATVLQTPPVQMVSPDEFQLGPPPNKFIEGPPQTQIIQRSQPPIQFLKNCPPQQFLQGPPPQQFLQGPPPQQFLQSPPPQQFLKSPPPQQFLQSPPPQQFLQSPPPQQFLQSPPPQQFLQSPPPQQFFLSSPPSQLNPLQPSPVTLYQQGPSDRSKADQFISSHVMSIPKKSEAPSYPVSSASSSNTFFSAPPPTPPQYTQRPPLFASCPATVFFPSTQALAFPGQISSVIFPTPQTCPAQQTASGFSSGPADPLNKSLASIAAEAAASPTSTSSAAAGSTTTTTTTTATVAPTAPKDLLKMLRANTKHLLPSSSLEAENKDCSMPTPPPLV